LFDSIFKTPEASLRGALATKQSIPSFLRRDGLLRYARNDEKHTFSFSRLIAPEVCMKFVALESKEGAGNAGCALHPRSRVQW
jgi:hypothetical protein